MSAEYPIVAITGASGAGASAVLRALERIFYRERIKAVYVDGSGFHRYDRNAMREAVATAKAAGRVLSHFSPEGNHLDKLEALFAQYAQSGTGQSRYYLRTREQGQKFGQEDGTFTAWQDLPADNDLLLYRGLHGTAVIGETNIAQYPDLTIGITPNANLEWMRKLYWDTFRGYSKEEVQTAILERLHDYVQYITPQFSRTHINFQLIPLVDTSDPFGEESVPRTEECYLVIRFAKKISPDFKPLLKQLPGAFMSRHNTLVVESSRMLNAMELTLMPMIHKIIQKSRAIRGIAELPEERGLKIEGLLET